MSLLDSSLIIFFSHSWMASILKEKTSPTMGASRRLTMHTYNGQKSLEKKSNFLLFPTTLSSCSGSLPPMYGAASTALRPSSCAFWQELTLLLNLGSMVHLATGQNSLKTGTALQEVNLILLKGALFGNFLITPCPAIYRLIQLSVQLNKTFWTIPSHLFCSKFHPCHSEYQEFNYFSVLYYVCLYDIRFVSVMRVDTPYLYP